MPSCLNSVIQKNSVQKDNAVDTTTALPAR